MTDETPEIAFYDVYSRRQKRTGEMYLNDARLLTVHGTVVLEGGLAERVPAMIALLLNQRVDLYIVPSKDQTPPPADRTALAPELVEDDFEPLPEGAITGATPAGLIYGTEPGQIDPETNHRVVAPQPELSADEIAARKLAGEAHLAMLPVSEQPQPVGGQAPAPDDGGAAPTDVVLPLTVEASDGAPIDIPAGVEPGVTPGWPVDEHGRPVRLSDEDRVTLAATQLEQADPVVVPVPAGFEATTAEGDARCLSAKADGTQCQNPATPGAPSCNTPGHEDKVLALAPGV